jgi:hypothetical protein
LEYLADSYAPEAQVAFDETLWVPPLIRNYTDAPKKSLCGPFCPPAGLKSLRRKRTPLNRTIRILFT